MFGLRTAAKIMDTGANHFDDKGVKKALRNGLTIRDYFCEPEDVDDMLLYCERHGIPLENVLSEEEIKGLKQAQNSSDPLAAIAEALGM